jgi:hypothetical protein
MSDTTMTLLFIVIFSLWLAAIGRILQQPMVGLAKPRDDAGRGAAPSGPVTPGGTPAVA